LAVLPEQFRLGGLQVVSSSPGPVQGTEGDVILGPQLPNDSVQPLPGPLVALPGAAGIGLAQGVVLQASEAFPLQALSQGGLPGLESSAGGSLATGVGLDGPLAELEGQGLGKLLEIPAVPDKGRAEGIVLEVV